MTHVAIIGAGEIGQALTHVLAKNSEVTVSLWDKQEGRVPDQKPLKDVISTANCVMLCVPSWVIRDVMREVVGHLSPTTVVISLAKGIEEKTLKTMDQVLSEELPVTLNGIIGGPLLGEELTADLPGIGVLASSDERVLGRVMPIFTGTNMHLEHNSDMRGVALCGVIKNVFTIGAGMADVLEFGFNFRGWLIKEACTEMADMLNVLGADRSTAYTSAGLADLVATSSGAYSKNYQAGQQIAVKGMTDQKSEGIASLPQLLTLLGTNADAMPLLSMIKQVVVDKKNPRESIVSLLQHAQW